MIVDNNDLRGHRHGNIEEWSVTKSTTGVMKGTLTFNWDQGDSTTPVKWTQVAWDGLNGVYHDVQLSIPGVPFNQQFPGTEEMCLVSSTLVQVEITGSGRGKRSLTAPTTAGGSSPPAPQT